MHIEQELAWCPGLDPLPLQVSHFSDVENFMSCFLPVYASFNEIDKSYQEQSLLSVLYAQTSAEYSANNMQTYKNAKIVLDKAIIDMNWSAALEQKNNPHPPIYLLILILLGLLL